MANGLKANGLRANGLLANGLRKAAANGLVVAVVHWLVNVL